MQKSSSIHQLILKIQHILGSHELNEHAIFDHAHPKTIEITFNFLKFAAALKNQFIPSIHS